MKQFYLKIYTIITLSIFSLCSGLPPEAFALRPEAAAISPNSIAQEKDDSKKTVLDIAMEQFGHLDEMVGFSDDAVKILSTPEKVFEVEADIFLDNDNPYETSSARVRFSTAIGVSKGGERFTIHPFNVADAQGLAFLMAVKCAGMNLPMGGGKGEAAIDINKLNPNEIARITKEIIWQLMEQHRAFGQEIDIPAPDQNTGKTIMAYMTEAFLAWKLLRGQGLRNKKAEMNIRLDPDVSEVLSFYKNDDARKRKKRDSLDSDLPDTLTPILDAVMRARERGEIVEEIATFTDKPLNRGGAKGREEATGLGGYFAEVSAIEHYAQEGHEFFKGRTGVDGIWHALRGFGNVASHYALNCHLNGGKFTAVKVKVDNEEVGIKYIGPKDGPGIDIPRLAEYVETERRKIFEQETANKPGMSEQEKDDLWELLQKREIDLRGYKQKDVIAMEQGEDIIDIDADLLVEAATQCMIHEGNAALVRQKMVLELGNATTTRRADIILAQKGVIVIPDVLANAGGVTVSMYEIKQNLTGQEWPLELTYARLEERIRQAMRAMFELKAQMARYHYELSNRDAHWLLALARISKAIEARMWKNNDPRLEAFVSGIPPILRKIYTSPQTDEEIAYLYAKGPSMMQEAIDEENFARTERIRNIVAAVISHFDKSRRDKTLARICLIGGPKAYKVQLVKSIIEQLKKMYGLRGVYIDIDPPENSNLAGNLRQLPSLLRGEESEIIELDAKTGELVKKKIKIDHEKDVIIAEGSLGIENHTLGVLPESSIPFTLAVDICPCMNIRIGPENNMMLTNDDYTILRGLLIYSLQWPKTQDPYESLARSIKQRDAAIGKIYASFRNRAMELYNTYDPFELLFSKEKAMPQLMSAREKARAIVLESPTGSNEKAAAEKVLGVSQRLITLLSAMPDVAVDAPLELPDAAGLRQVLPDDIYRKRFIPRASGISGDLLHKGEAAALINSAA